MEPTIEDVKALLADFGWHPVGPDADVLRYLRDKLSAVESLERELDDCGCGDGD